MRDVKHILATTSEQVDASIAPVIVDGITYHEWVVNEVGYTYHNYYGFGGIDATAAVNSAKSYTGGSLGAQSTLDWISTGTIDLDIGFGSTVTRAINVPTCRYSGIRFSPPQSNPRRSLARWDFASPHPRAPRRQSGSRMLLLILQ
jgi:hypothetical protein